MDKTAQYGSEQVEEKVQQNGIVNAAAFLTDIPQKQSDAEGVNTLHHIHVECAEEHSLKQVGSPEGERLFRLAQSDTAENQLFGNRG